MKFLTAILIVILMATEIAQAVQVAFFVDDQNPGLSLEGEFSHVAISYKGRWLHAHPSKVSGRLSNFPGVHITQNLMEIGLNFVVFENINLEDPDEDFYNQFKDRKFNMLAEWESKTETHCAHMSGKYFNAVPLKMKFKGSVWRNIDVSSMRGKPGLSPQDLYKHIKRDPQFYLYYKSPFSTYSGSIQRASCSSILGR